MKILYKLEENSGVYGRLLAWLAIMFIFFIGYLTNNLEKIFFIDLMNYALMISLFYSQIILFWLVNILNEKYKKEFSSVEIENVNNFNKFSEISYLVLDSVPFVEEKQLKVSYLANSDQIYEIKDIICKENINKSKIEKSMNESIVHNITLMNDTEYKKFIKQSV